MEAQLLVKHEAGQSGNKSESSEADDATVVSVSVFILCR